MFHSGPADCATHGSDPFHNAMSRRISKTARPAAEEYKSPVSPTLQRDTGRATSEAYVPNSATHIQAAATLTHATIASNSGERPMKLPGVVAADSCERVRIKQSTRASARSARRQAMKA